MMLKAAAYLARYLHGLLRKAFTLNGV